MSEYCNKDSVDISIDGKLVNISLNNLNDKRVDYTQIHTYKDLPENNIVYQNDCGWWYDWDLSGKSVDELETLFQTNIIYKREGKQ
jgi:hypothetical protein|tara:strand:- start:513 stop:770 length:258 start_codon:yes stop_codon:yes gene_type:complete